MSTFKTEPSPSPELTEPERSGSVHAYAEGNGEGNQRNQLNHPTDMIVDEKNDSVIICDWGKKRLVRWPRQNGTNEETIISDIHCFGLTVDNDGTLYVSNWKKNKVRLWKVEDKKGTIIAGGCRQGNNINQLNFPTTLFVDKDRSVYVSDRVNYCVMKWMKGAKGGIIVAGGQEKGNSLRQLSYPHGIFVDQWENIYVADGGNHRIMRWSKGSKEGSIVIGENGEGNQPNQLNYPVGLSFNQ